MQCVRMRMHAHKKKLCSACIYMCIAHVHVCMRVRARSLINVCVTTFAVRGGACMLSGAVDEKAIDVSAHNSNGITFSPNHLGRELCAFASFFFRKPKPTMQVRPLGAQGLVVTRIGLGAMGMTAFYNDVSAVSANADGAGGV